MLALDDPPERFGFRLAWSRWRRHHQAVAKRGHAARRARRVAAAPTAAPATVRPLPDRAVRPDPPPADLT
ncbi:MAG: hypothetical protein LC769_09545, partial [Chloroflexi bacterium]|nr:hypothetical protein [Chloroflexota bacterium]